MSVSESTPGTPDDIHVAVDELLDNSSPIITSAPGAGKSECVDGRPPLSRPRITVAHSLGDVVIGEVISSRIEKAPEDEGEKVYRPEDFDTDEVLLIHDPTVAETQKEGRVLRQTVTEEGKIVRSGLAETIYRATDRK
ncbi:MAG TPA: hypothetical protein VN031_00760 [Candidatus Microsaccharimonas sp.]|nr:hypothetical protein [Candidatus Microsaccharimonas sp.]